MRLFSMLAAAAVAMPISAVAHPHDSKRGGEHSLSTGKRGYLGVETQAMTPELREFFGAPKDSGVLVVRVSPDGPAATAGLRVGDVIVSVGQDPIAHPASLFAAIAVRPGGSKMDIRIVRDDDEDDVEVELGSRDDGFRWKNRRKPHRKWRNESWPQVPDFPELGPRFRERMQQLEERLKQREDDRGN